MLVASVASAELGPPDFVLATSIECDGIAARNVESDVYLTSQASRGTLIFVGGGNGGGSYTGPAERAKTVEIMRDAGFDSYALRFTDELGWYTGAEGHGSRGGTCVYADAVRWVQQNAANPDVICVQGNSSAGVFIGFGIQEHGLDEIVDLAVPTSGPSATLPIEMCEGVFGNPSQETREEIDLSMGWTIGTCTGNSPLTEEQRAALLIDGLAYRENLVHGTKIFAMMDETDKSKQYVAGWFDTMIPPTRKWVRYFQDIGHKFDKHPEGARHVRKVLLALCRE